MNNSTANCTKVTTGCVNVSVEGIPLFFADLKHHPLNIVAYLYIFPCLFLFGVLGNVLNIIILNKRAMRSKTSIFLTAMACADLAFFTMMLPNALEKSSLRGYKWFFEVWIQCFTPTIFGANWMSATSIWLTVCLNIERLIAVRLPFQAPSILLKRRYSAAVIIVFIFSLSASLYFPFVHKVYDAKVCNSCSTTSDIRRGALGRGDAQKVFKILWLLVCLVLPMLLLIVFNSLLMISVRKMRDNELIRSNSTDSSRRPDGRVTRTVIVVICSFVLFNLPSGTIGILTSIFSLERSMSVKYAETLSNLWVVVGKCSNFIIYCMTSPKFRQNLFTFLHLRKDINVWNRQSTQTTGIYTEEDRRRSSIMYRFIQTVTRTGEAASRKRSQSVMFLVDQPLLKDSQPRLQLKSKSVRIELQPISLDRSRQQSLA